MESSAKILFTKKKGNMLARISTRSFAFSSKTKSNTIDIRSALFLPAHQERFYKKGVQFSPSIYVPDMEDSVPTNEKDHARALCREKIKFLHTHNPNVMIFPRPNELVFGCDQFNVGQNVP